MKRVAFKKKQCAVASIAMLLVAVCAGPAIAQAPSGPFHYLITNYPLWDVTGSYTNNVTTEIGLDHAIMNLIQSATGALTGSRTDSVGGVGSDNFTTLTGKVKGKNGAVSGKVKMTGTANAEGYTGRATGKGTATLDPATMTLYVGGSAKLCVDTPIGTKCKSFTFDSTQDLPPGANGDWTLDTDVTANGTTLSGSATVTLSNDRVLHYSLSGTYSATADSAKMKLVGTGDAAGTGFSLTTQGASMTLTALKGKVLGQKPVLP